MYSGTLPCHGCALITGATGFVGGRLVQRLLRAGVAAERLRLLVRDPDRAHVSGLPAASLWRGDLADTAETTSLRAAAAGVDLVVHLAGTVKGRRRAAFDAVNAHGTAALLAAVRAVAPQAHVVHVSSLAAAGPSRDGRGSAADPEQCRPVSWYGASKLAGERHVVASGLPWTVLRPPVVYGPGDSATALMFRQACGLLCPVPRQPRPLSVVHVDDVVDAVLAAAERRVHGAVLPLDGPERTDTHALLRAMARACGRRARLLPVPIALAAIAASVAESFGFLRGGVGHFNRDKVREIRAAGWVADAALARQALGWSARIGLADGLAAVARSLAARPPATLT